MENKKRIELAEWIKDFALQSGADETAVSISNRREIDIQYRDKKLEKLKESTQNSLTIQIYANQRYSAHSTNNLKKNQLETFIEEAVSSTKYLSKDEYRSLPDPKYYPKTMDKKLNIYDKNYEYIEPNERVQMSKEIESAAMEQSNHIISSTASYSDIHYQSVLIHSNGFLGQSEGTIFSAGAEVTVKDKEKGRPEDWFYSSVRFHDELPDPETIGKNAAEKALRKIGQSKIQTGKYDMIVENRSAARMLSLFQTPMSARALQQKSSFLEGMLDKKIASEKLTVIDEPFLEKGLGSRFYDGEGLVAQQRIMIEKGILRHYYVDNYYGKKLDMEPTTSSPSNVIFEYGSKSLDELIKEFQNGILVTGFLGGNSNSTTGDFSFGIVGILIENGEIVKPVNEMNISGNAKKVWHQLVEVGNDPYPYSSHKTPSLVFEQIQFSGI